MPSTSNINNNNNSHNTILPNNNNRHRLSVYLYIPNLLGYARIVLALVGLHSSQTSPQLSIILWNISAFLDFLDGILARQLNQTSKFGIYLDIIADNVLRGACWMASSDNKVLSLIIISLEWTTMLCTQLASQQQQGHHWKNDLAEQDFWLIRRLFQNNFRNPLGIWSIYGLFAANQFYYAEAYKDLFEPFIPLYHYWKWMAYTGRMLASICEVHLIAKYLKHIVQQDQDEKEKSG